MDPPADALATRGQPLTAEKILRKYLSLKTPALFKKTYAEGRFYSAREVVIHFLKLDDEGLTQVGFSLSKKVGNAVVRNKIKRRLKSIVGEKADLLKPGYIIVFVGRPAARETPYGELKKAVERLLKQAGLVKDEQ